MVTCLHAVFGCDLPTVLGEAANVKAPWEGQRSGFWIFFVITTRIHDRTYGSLPFPCMQPCRHIGHAQILVIAQIDDQTGGRLIYGSLPLAQKTVERSAFVAWSCSRDNCCQIHVFRKGKLHFGESRKNRSLGMAAVVSSCRIGGALVESQLSKLRATLAPNDVPLGLVGLLLTPVVYKYTPHRRELQKQIGSSLGS